MRSWMRARMTYANVMVTIVAFIVLGGSAYAAKEVGKNSVDTNAIQKNAVTGSKIKSNAVGGGDIKQDSVAGGDIREETLKAIDAATLNGKTADEIEGGGGNGPTPRFALINELGQIEAQTGGFSLVNCYQANGNCYIDTGSDARNKGLSATIGINNTDGADSMILSGQIGVAPCGLTSVLCGPEGTENNEVVVVAPRDSEGNVFGGGPGAPTPGQAARFYVHITNNDATVSPVPTPES